MPTVHAAAARRKSIRSHGLAWPVRHTSPTRGLCCTRETGGPGSRLRRAALKGGAWPAQQTRLPRLQLHSDRVLHSTAPRQ